MDPFTVYKTYVATKLHFRDPRYDYLEKKGLVALKPSSLEKRKDKAFFEQVSRKLEEKSEVLQFFVANFVDSPDAWIGDLTRNGGFDIYDGWRRRFKKIRSEMTYDLQNIEVLLSKNSIGWSEALFPGSGYPLPFKLYRRKMICPETFVLLQNGFGFCDTMPLSSSIDPIWRETTFNLHKYSRFLVTITVERYGDLLKRIQSETGVNPHLPTQGERRCQAA